MLKGQGQYIPINQNYDQPKCQVLAFSSNFHPQPLTKAFAGFPLYACSVSAGFPSPADDYMERKLDLNDYLIKRPSATYYVRAVGDSMIGAGIFDGDLLIVDRSLNVVNDSIVIAAINGDLMVIRYVTVDNVPFLVPENKKYKTIELDKDSDVYVWGVVTSVIHKFQ